MELSTDQTTKQLNNWTIKRLVLVFGTMYYWARSEKSLRVIQFFPLLLFYLISHFHFKSNNVHFLTVCLYVCFSLPLFSLSSAFTLYLTVELSRFHSWFFSFSNLLLSKFVNYRVSQKHVPLSHKKVPLFKKEPHIWTNHNKTNNFRGLFYGTLERFFWGHPIFFTIMSGRSKRFCLPPLSRIFDIFLFGPPDTKPLLMFLRWVLANLHET